MRSPSIPAHTTLGGQTDKIERFCSRRRTRMLKQRSLLFPHAALAFGLQKAHALAHPVRHMRSCGGQYPIAGAVKPAIFAHGAGVWPVREQMPPHSLPTARAFFPHFPVFSNGVWGFAPCLSMALAHSTNRTAKPAIFAHGAGNYFAREYMLSHSLPTARTFYSHFPISMS